MDEIIKEYNFLDIIEVLHSIEVLDYHNKNYLTNNRKFLNEEKRRLLMLIADDYKNHEK